MPDIIDSEETTAGAVRQCVEAEERCPFCNSGQKRFEPDWGKEAHSFSCGTIFRGNGEVALRWGDCQVRETRWLRRQLAQANAHNAQLLRVVERLASPDEMGGMGVVEEMTGPAAVELRVRMQYANAALSSSTPGVDTPCPRCNDNPHAATVSSNERPYSYGRFRVREDEDGRRYWWGSEEGMRDGEDEVGEDGVITIDARHFAVGTVIEMREPVDLDDEEDGGW